MIHKIEMSWRPVAACLLVALMLGTVVLTQPDVPRAEAAAITVNSTVFPGVAGDGLCSLDEALANANTDSDTSGGDCVAGNGDDVITLNDGLYLVDGLSINDPDNATTVQGQSRDGVVIGPRLDDDEDPSLFGGQWQSAFMIESDDITIQTLTVDGAANAALPGTQNFRHGIHINPSFTAVSNLTVQDITLREVQLYGVLGGGLPAGTAANNIIRDSYFDDGGNRAIGVYEASATIEDNTIVNAGEGIWTFGFGSGGPTVNIRRNAITDPRFTGMNIVGSAGLTQNNTIDMADNGDQVGIIYWYMRGDMAVRDNQITGNDNDTGLVFYNNDLAHTMTVEGNLLLSSGTLNPANGFSTGILLTDWGGGDLSTIIGDNDGGTASATINGNTISGWYTGIDLFAHNATPRAVQATIGSGSANIITGNQVGIRVYEGNGVTGGYVSTATVDGNHADAGGNWGPAIFANGTGILVDGGLATVTNNVIAENTAWAIQISDETGRDGALAGGGAPLNANNCLVSNTGGATNLDGAATEDLQTNWWGDVAGPVDGAPPANADAVNGLINTAGFLTDTTSVGNCTAVPLLPPSISKAFAPNPVAVNTSSTLTLSIINPNPVALTNVAVTDNLPAGVLIATPPNITNSCGGTVTAPAAGSSLALSGGNLGPSGTCSLSVNVVSATPATYTNITEPVIAVGQTVPGNSASAVLTVEEEGEEPEEPGPGDDDPVVELTDPAISKIGLLGPGELGLPGETITWEITVRNTGGGDATNVVVTDTLNSDLQILNATTPQGTASISGQTVTFSLGTVASGQSITMQIVTRVLGSPLDGLFLNRACLSGGLTGCADASINVVIGLPDTGYPPADE